MTRTAAPVSKDRKVLRRIDQGAAWNSVTGLLAALAVFVLVAYWGRLYFDDEGLVIGFGLAILLVTAYRLLVALRFDSLYAAGPARWRRLFGIGLLAHAIVWGALLAVVTLRYGISFNFFAVAVYNIGVTTALSGAWMAALPTRQSYIGLMLVPGIVALVLVGGAQSLILALLLAVYAVYLYRMFAGLYDTFWHALSRERRPGHAAEAPQEDPQKRSRDVQLSLVYRLAHELRTPMNSVLGMLALMEETRLSREQREYHQVASQSGRLLLSLIDDVLDYSRVLTGRIVLDYEFFDLRSAIEQSLDAYGNIAQGKGLELTCVMSRHLPRRVRGDRERFLQVLNNLLSNAIKFSDEGEIRIEVDHLGDAERDGLLQVRVVDHGIGMEPLAARRLFEDEFLGPDADPFSNRHTGFGLLVCKGLVEAMAGQIGVESAPGQGSTFWFTLRLPMQPELGDRSELRRALLDKRCLVAGAASGTVSALVEELDVLEAACQAATDYDHALQTLRSGQREQKGFDLLLVDTRDRRESALNLCRSVLDDPALRGVQVILLATVDERSHAGVQKLVQQHALPVLTKPVHRYGLRSLLAPLYGVDEEQPGDDDYKETPEDLARRRNYRLLLVEDNEVNQRVMRGMLGKLGYQVESVSEGETALALMEQETFDLILMDCMMPDMDGFDVARRIREREHAEHAMTQTPLRRVPIVAITANTMEGVQARCLAAGMDDFLAKPLQLDRLETVLRHWLPAEAPAANDHDDSTPGAHS